jgi:hypothetical protein
VSLQYTKKEMASLMSLLIRLRDAKILLTPANVVLALGAAVDVDVSEAAISDADAAICRSAIDKLHREDPAVIENLVAQRGGVQVIGDDAVCFD